MYYYIKKVLLAGSDQFTITFPFTHHKTGRHNCPFLPKILTSHVPLFVNVKVCLHDYIIFRSKDRIIISIHFPLNVI